MQNGSTCCFIDLVGTPEQIGLAQAEFILESQTAANLWSTRLWADATPDSGMSLARSVSHWYPALELELTAMAQRLGLSPYSILGSWAPKNTTPERAGCSMIGVVSPSGPIVGRTFDLGFSLFDARVLHTHLRGGRTSLGSGGWIGRYDGINSDGLVAAMAIIEGQNRTSPEDMSLPATLMVRMLLDNCGSVDDCLQMINAIPCWSPVNYLLADAHGAVVVVERDHGRMAARLATPETPAVATNHFISNTPVRKHSEERHAILSSANAYTLHSADGVASLLGSVSNPRLTRWCEVFTPKALSMRYAGGHDVEYRTFTV